jgi:YegS/Rv2252/BmrU family lipid kinase
MKAAIIVNPFAGKRKAPEILPLAEKIAAGLGIELAVSTIEGPGRGAELSRAAADEGAERIVCVGGDGSLNAVAVGLLGTKVPLGIVPMGSGNGYARSLGLPQRPEDALRVAFTGRVQPMDVGFLNGRLFLGTAGIGFDASVAERFDRTKRRGMLAYLRIALEEIARAKTINVRITANGRTHDAELLMIVFCNTGEFGNGVRISPSSRPDDGVAEIRLVSKPPFRSLPMAFLYLYTRRGDRLRHIRSILAREALICHESTLSHLDGEPVSVGSRVHFRLESGKIMVAAPHRISEP